MFEATLSIDLGASFTKVAWRKACQPNYRRSVVETAKVLAVDGSALIPSVAIRTGRTQQPWVFGQDAAGLRPGPKMEVFRNWKAQLFQFENNRDSVAAAVVAENFFRWLRAEIMKSGLDLRNCRVTVAMPAFREFKENSAVILRCMSLAGWEDVIPERVTEPHSNLLGLMANGTSAVQVNRAGVPFVNYGRMFGQSSPWVRAARDFALFSRGPSRLSILVIDIGAFTTDFAQLVFDFTDDNHLGDGLSTLHQLSSAHGVFNQLDRPLLATLAERNSIEMSQFSMSEIELLKSAIYDSRAFELVTRDGRVVRLGEGGDLHTIGEMIASFSAGVWSHAREFMGQHQVHLAYLTGGGSLIPKVRDEIARELRLRGIRLVELAMQSTSKQDSKWRECSKADGGLERLATALGGTSVVLQLSQEPELDGQPHVINREPPPLRPTNPATCRCQGLNPECSFCGGRGYL